MARRKISLRIERSGCLWLRWSSIFTRQCNRPANLERGQKDSGQNMEDERFMTLVHVTLMNYAHKDT